MNRPGKAEIGGHVPLMKEEEAREPDWRVRQAQGMPRRKNGKRGTGDREIHLGGHQRNDRTLVEITEWSRPGAPGF